MSANSNDATPNQPPQDPGATSQAVPQSPMGARVPEKVGHGVFSTAVLVLQTGQEFILDFVQGIVQPRHIAARIVLSPLAVQPLIEGLRNSLNQYQAQFGALPPIRPPQPPVMPPSTEEIYQQFRLADELLSGVYANAAMIVHTQTEFCLDFITTFYPRPAVSCRVFLAAPQAPIFLNALAQSFEQYRQRQAAPPGGPQQPPTK
jgi:hypothetical protein